MLGREQVTERVLKHFYPPSLPGGEPDPNRRVEDLTRELGRKGATEKVLRDALERERQRADRAEAELEEIRCPFWKKFLGG